MVCHMSVDSCVTVVAAAAAASSTPAVTRSGKGASTWQGHTRHTQRINARIGYLRGLGKAAVVRMCQELSVIPESANLTRMIYAIVDAEELRREQEEDKEQADTKSGKAC